MCCTMFVCQPAMVVPVRGLDARHRRVSRVLVLCHAVRPQVWLPAQRGVARLLHHRLHAERLRHTACQGATLAHLHPHIDSNIKYYYIRKKFPYIILLTATDQYFSISGV